MIDGNRTRGGGGKRFLWDFSRQIQVKVLNLHVYATFRLPLMKGRIYRKQPLEEDMPETFPPATFQGVGVIGNDDGHATDAVTEPYDSSPEGGMTCTDTPSIGMLPSTGDLGETFEVRFIFNEFVRVLLANQWVRMSDQLKWHTFFRFVKGPTQWTSTGLTQGGGHGNW